jgi:Flp pilus assembly protein TadG
MRQGATSSSLCGRLSRFARARDGVSAVEFALILPFMLTLYLGGSELGDGLAVQFKVTLAARTVADLVSQCGNSSIDGQYCDTANDLPIDSTSMSQIVGSSQVVGAAETIMTPYPTTNMVTTVSELKFTGGSTSATVVWSASNSGNGRTTGSTYALPAAYQSLPSGTYYVILGEATYPYTPTMGYVLTGTINIYQSTIFFPRNSSCVQYYNNSTYIPASC